jgi:hypothetical protein
VLSKQWMKIGTRWGRENCVSKKKSCVFWGELWEIRRRHNNWWKKWKQLTMIKVCQPCSCVLYDGQFALYLWEQ